MATKEQVEQFLQELKRKITFFEIAFRPREKNLEALAELEITAIEREEYLKNLKVEDYYSGPNKDTHDSSKPDYYEFGIIHKGVDVYIKVSLGLPNKRVDCMSFHKAERPITYPFK